MDRIYLEAILVGLCIGVAALVLDRVFGEASWLLRFAVLIIVGGLLSLVQYLLLRRRR